MTSSSVLFPAPLGPMRTRNSPRCSLMLSVLIAVKPPKRTVRSSTFRISSGTSLDWKPMRRTPLTCDDLFRRQQVFYPSSSLLDPPDNPVGHEHHHDNEQRPQEDGPRFLGQVVEVR